MRKIDPAYCTVQTEGVDSKYIHNYLRIRGEKMPKPFKINKEKTTSVKHGPWFGKGGGGGQSLVSGISVGMQSGE